ncbi:multidrug effflux MFS transporter [Microvirga yunnanensis]|uniref:multidrug effflux MFS transporter n=1 Tax=Microvirga yunnanensis TaxID=2953740 RepID=UPI0021C5D20A|nr:multidrug effflux MFS transporter [Microvirga sp. HBU65207]
MSLIETLPADAATPAAARRLTPGLLALLAGLAAIGALSTNIILPSFPSIAAALHVPPRDLGLTLSSFFIAFAVGQLFVGPLSDRFGRRWFVLGGLTVFIVGSAVGAGAESFPVLIAGRVVQALGVCASSVLSRAIARDLFDGETLARALSLTLVAMAAAPGFSPLLGSALDAQFGWRAAFLVVGALAALLALCYAMGAGETHPADRRAAASLGATMRDYGGLLADLRFVLPALAVSLVVGGLYAFFAAAPAILILSLGLSPLQLGLFFAATVFVVFAGGLLAPRLAQKWGARSIATLGIVLALLSGALLLAASAAPTFPGFAAAITVFLLGMGLVNPLGTAIALHPFGRQAGLASALLGFLQMACAALGTALTTSLPLSATGALGVILTGGSALALLIFHPTHRKA